MRTTELPPELTDRKFEIVVRRLADDLKYGQDASPFVGSGIDYVQSRPFEEGDPIRDIDWRVSARAGRYYVKQYESLKCTPVYLVVDTSASMSFSSTAISKHFLAVLIAGGLGFTALRRTSPVGVLSGGERELHFEPSLLRGRIFQWLHALRRRRFDEGTCLAGRLDRLRGLLTSRCLIVLLSDLHDADAVAAVKRLARRHDCAVIQLEDPAEQGGLRAGFIRAAEAETGESFVAHGGTRWFHENDSAPRPGTELKSVGIDHLLLSTGQPFVPPLRRFLGERGGLMHNER